MVAQWEPADWAYLMPLPPLALLMATGPCVFDMPDAAGTRSSAEDSGDG